MWSRGVFYAFMVVLLSAAVVANDFDDEFEGGVQHTIDNGKGGNIYVEEDEEDEPVRFYDEDEFEGFVVPERADDVPVPPIVSHVPTPVSFGPKDEETYYWEFVGIAVVAVYVVVFFIGRSTNQNIASKWLAEFQPLLETQFAEVGLGTDTEAEMLIKESHNSFQMYCTGRRACSAAVFTVSLRKRQDLFSLVLSMFFPERDSLFVEVAVGEEVDPCVLAVMRKRDTKSLIAEYSDLKDFPAAVPASSAPVPRSMNVVADAAELVPLLLHTPVAKTLEKYEALVRLVQLTDQNTLPLAGVKEVPPRMLRCEFLLPPNHDMAELRTLVEMSLHLLDRAASPACRLSKEGKKRAEARRSAIAEQKFKANREQREEEREAREGEGGVRELERRGQAEGGRAGGEEEAQANEGPTPG